MRFNRPSRNVTKTTNKEGALAYTPSDKVKLYLMCASQLMKEDKFYGDTTSETITLAKTVLKADPEYVLKLAVFLRNDLYLRSVPIALLVEAANCTEAKPYVKLYADYIIMRADELAEVVSYQLKNYKKPIPKQLKLALANAFHRFDEYQFAKYDKDGEVKLRDVIRLVHPTPLDSDEDILFGKINARKLNVPETWETYISSKGSTKENWEYISTKMPIFATIRNLNNFLKKEVNTDLYLPKLSNPDIILKSKMYPFRFYSAYKMVKQNDNPNAAAVLDALEDAVELSVKNIPHLKGTTMLVTDHSGSMSTNLSDKSQMSYKEVADVMMALSNKICDKSICGAFGDTFEVAQLSKRSIIQNATQLAEIDVGCSTNGFEIIKYMINKKLNVDRLIIFTDCQLWNSDSYNDYTNPNSDFQDLWHAYQKEINTNTKLYLVDLAGYGTTLFPEGEKNIVCIAGWNEKLIDFISMVETNPDTMINKIENMILE